MYKLETVLTMSACAMKMNIDVNYVILIYGDAMMLKRLY